MTSMPERPTSLSTFFRGASFYGLSVAVAKIGNFLILPFFWHALSPEDFGLIGIIQLAQALLLPIFSLGLFDGVLRFYVEWDEAERRHLTGAVLTLVFAWLATIATVLYLCRDAVTLIFTTVPPDPFVAIAIATAALTCINQLPLTIHRIRGEAKRYSVLVSLVFVAQSAFSALFVFGLGGGVVGYLLGGVAAQIFWMGFLYRGVRHDIRLNARWGSVRPMLSYSVPMIPSTILDSTISLFDRFFLDKYVPLGQIGLYNVAQQFASLVSMVNQSFKSAWFPFVFRLVREEKDAPALLSRFSLYYLGLMTPPAVAVAVFGDDVLRLVGPEKFHGAAPVIPWLVLAAYLQVLVASFGRGLDLAKKNRLWVLISAVHVTVSLAMLALLVPRFGVMGASWAVGAAVGVRALLQCALAFRAYPRPLPIARILSLWVVAGGAVWLCLYPAWPSLWVSIAAKAAIVAVASLLMMGAFVDAEGWSALRRRFRGFADQGKGRNA